VSIEKEMLDQAELDAYRKARLDNHTVPVIPEKDDSGMYTTRPSPTPRQPLKPNLNRSTEDLIKEVQLKIDSEKASGNQVGGSHYKTFKIQPSKYCYENDLGWLESNVVKYTTRHKLKGGLEDIKKAEHYLQLIKEWHYNV
jgi:hypothetical protein